MISVFLSFIYIGITTFLSGFAIRLLARKLIRYEISNIYSIFFGGLAVVYVSKNWKLALAPLIFMVILFLAVPSLASSVGVLVPVGVLIALGSARILYKKGWA